MSRLLRNTIQGITKPALKRLAYTAGIANLSGIAYEELRGLIKVKTEDIIRDAVTYAYHYRKRTIDEYIISACISPTMWTKQPKAKSCGRPRKSTSSRKSAPGVQALRNIKFYQSRSDCLNIPIASFDRFVREVTQDFALDMRYTKNALIILQYSVENYIVHILQKALQIAILSKRVTVEPKDINFAVRY